MHRRTGLLRELVDVEPVGRDAHARTLLGGLRRPLRASDVMGVGPIGSASDVVGRATGNTLIFHAPSGGVGGGVGVAGRASRPLAIGVRQRGSAAVVVVRLEAADHLGPELEVRLVGAVVCGARDVAKASAGVAWEKFVGVGVHVADADDVVLEAGVVGGAGGGQVRVGVRGVVGVDHWETVAQGVVDVEAGHRVGGHRDRRIHQRRWQPLEVAQAFVIQLAHRVTPFVLAEGAGAAELVQVIDHAADRLVRRIAGTPAVGCGDAVGIGPKHARVFFPFPDRVGA